MGKNKLRPANSLADHPSKPADPLTNLMASASVMGAPGHLSLSGASCLFAHAVAVARLEGLKRTCARLPAMHLSGLDGQIPRRGAHSCVIAAESTTLPRKVFQDEGLSRNSTGSLPRKPAELLPRKPSLPVTQLRFSQRCWAAAWCICCSGRRRRKLKDSPCRVCGAGCRFRAFATLTRSFQTG